MTSTTPHEQRRLREKMRGALKVLARCDTRADYRMNESPRLSIRPRGFATELCAIVDRSGASPGDVRMIQDAIAVVIGAAGRVKIGSKS